MLEIAILAISLFSLRKERCTMEGKLAPLDNYTVEVHCNNQKLLDFMYWQVLGNSCIRTCENMTITTSFESNNAKHVFRFATRTFISNECKLKFVPVVSYMYDHYGCFEHILKDNEDNVEIIIKNALSYQMMYNDVCHPTHMQFVGLPEYINSYINIILDGDKARDEKYYINGWVSKINQCCVEFEYKDAYYVKDDNRLHKMMPVILFREG